jgi:hypothetical protein
MVFNGGFLEKDLQPFLQIKLVLHMLKWEIMPNFGRKQAWDVLIARHFKSEKTCTCSTLF